MLSVSFRNSSDMVSLRGSAVGQAPSTFCDILEAWRKIPNAMTSSRMPKAWSTPRTISTWSPLYFSQTIEADVEAEVIRGILESNGIPVIVSRVADPVARLSDSGAARTALEDARRVIEEQRPPARKPPPKPKPPARK